MADSTPDQPPGQTPPAPPAGAAASPPEAAAPPPEAPAVDPAARVAELEGEVASLNDRLLRALAEVENIRRRAERDRIDASKYAIATFAREMLLVADNLGRALNSVAPEARAADAALAALMEGVEMTARSMVSAFERAGIQAVPTEGRGFDHNIHEAMFELEDPSRPAGTIIQVLEPGYMLGDRLLRPARVGVSRGGPRLAPEGGASVPASPSKAEQEKKAGAQAYEQTGGAAGSKLNEEL